jgi:hypothetical protein
MALPFLFDIGLKCVKPNFSILSVHKMIRVHNGYVLVPVQQVEPLTIVEYKYNSKKLLHLSTSYDWPPKFTIRLPKITRVTYGERDVTERALKFAGPLQCEFNPLCTLPVKRRLFFDLGEFGKIGLRHRDFLCDVDKDKLVITR